MPPLFVHQLTQILLRHCLGDEATPAQARAAEMLFRPQRIAIQDGRVMAADEETVERHALSADFGAIGDLLRQAGAPLRAAELDVLGVQNADAYWERDEAHDFAICLNHGEPALAALCEVLERWVLHFTGTAVRVQVEREIDEAQWVWHVGLDAQASAILNDLYRGDDVPRRPHGAPAVPVPAGVRGARRDARGRGRAARCTWPWRWTKPRC